MFDMIRTFNRLALLPVLAGVVALPAMEGASEEYKRELAELKDMEELSPTGDARDISVFQVDIKVDDLERIVLVDRFGNGTVYHYLVFRIRNRISEATESGLEYKSRYNEILAQIASEYEGVDVDGNKLVVDTATPDDRLNTVLRRSELASNPRSLQLTATAYDENDTRIETLDAVHEGSQELYSFDDEGKREVAVDYDVVRKRIEEQRRRRLWLPAEIARKQLPPYNPNIRNEEGIAEGEIYGVAIFDRLDTEGDRWTFEFRGLSNRIRTRVPVHSPDQLSDYLNTRILRRMYTVEFQRHGDEYARDLDPWRRIDEGWEWDDTFQHLELRRHKAMAMYFLENIADAQNRPREEVLVQFREYYRELRDEHPDLPELKLGE